MRTLLIVTVLWPLACLPKHSSLPRATTTAATPQPKNELQEILARAPVMNATAAGLAYQSLAPESDRLDEETMVRLVSNEYLTSKDEFSRKDIRAQVVARLPDAVAASTEPNRYLVLINHQLPEYDFDRSGFGTGLSPSTVIPFTRKEVTLTPSGVPKIGLTFNNASDFGFAPVSAEMARSIKQALAKSRSALVILEVELLSAGGADLSVKFSKAKPLGATIWNLWLVHTPRNLVGKPLAERLIAHVAAEPASESQESGHAEDS